MSISLDVLLGASNKGANALVKACDAARLNIALRRFHSPDELHAALVDRTPDIVIAQKNLSGFSRRAVTDIVRETTPHVPLLLLTDREEDDDICSAKRDGYQDILSNDDVSSLKRFMRQRTGECPTSDSLVSHGIPKFYESIVSSMREGAIVLDSDGRILFINLSAAFMIGWHPREMHGKRFHDTLLFQLYEDPRQHPKTCPCCAPLHNTDPHATKEESLRNRDGTRLPVSLSVAPIDSSTEPSGRILIFEPEKEDQCIQQLLQVQRDLSIALSCADSLDAALNRLLEAALRIEGLDCGAVYLVDADSGELSMASQKGFPDEFVNHVAKCNSDALRRHLTVGEYSGNQFHGWPRDLATGPRGDYGLKSFAVIPVHYRERVVAVLEMASKTKAEIAGTAREAIEGIAARIGGVIDRAQANQALRESEARYQALAKASPVGLIRTDAAGRCLFVNDRWCEIAGVASEDAKGLSWTRSIHPEDRRRIGQAWLAAINERKPFREEFRFRRPGGSSVWVYGQARFETDHTGALIGSVGTITDITQRKRAEAIVDEHRREMEDFLSIVSHDLKRPLISMTGLLGIVKAECKDRIDSENLADLDVALDECRRMDGILNQLGELARIEQATVQLESVNLRELIAAMVERFRDQIEANGINVETKCPDANVLICRIQFEQALANLFENAIKYGCRGQGSPITLECRIDGRMLNVTVADQGPGIAPEYHDLVFQLFRRLETKTGHSGSGVGLAAVRRLTKRLGGAVKLDSDLGKGARFTITLPLNKTESRRANTGVNVAFSGDDSSFADALDQ